MLAQQFGEACLEPRSVEDMLSDTLTDHRAKESELRKVREENTDLEATLELERDQAQQQLYGQVWSQDLCKAVRRWVLIRSTTKRTNANAAVCQPNCTSPAMLKADPGSLVPSGHFTMH